MIKPIEVLKDTKCPRRRDGNRVQKTDENEYPELGVLAGRRELEGQAGRHPKIVTADRAHRHGQDSATQPPRQRRQNHGEVVEGERGGVREPAVKGPAKECRGGGESSRPKNPQSAEQLQPDAPCR